MFYQDWAQAKENGDNCLEFIASFLDCSEESIETFIDGNTEDVITAIKFLLSISMDELINSINTNNEFSSKDVFQYSNLDAVISLCNILEYEEKALSFFEAGQKLIKSEKELACVKYGENHIKLAAAFSLVKTEKIDCKKAQKARITALGSIFTKISNEERRELIKRLAIRNPFIKSLIFCGKNGEVTYRNLAAQVLSGQTILRRKHNVEILINMILENHPIKNNIRW